MTNKDQTHLENPSKLSERSGEHEVRVQKVKEMRAAGIEPWPQFKPVNATCQEVLAEFQEPSEGQPSKEYQIAGRVIALREHGKTIFATIQDRTGRLQIYLRNDEIGQDRFDFFKKFIDLGDIVWCNGTSFRTKMGEITLKVASFELLSKCLHPLPEKFHGIHDVEIKHRQRYLDLISSPESRERFKKRSKIIRLMREFFDKHDFIEVETPMLHAIPGGAAAKPFLTHHNALDMQLFLRIAPELFLKRLTIGGLERVYEINRNFRNEGVSTRHNPEFTSVEWYIANQDYHWMMDFVEELLKYIVKNVNDSMVVQYGDMTIDFGKPFVRMAMRDAVMQYVGCTQEELAGDNIDALLKKHKIKPADKNASWGQKLYALFEELVESKLIQPTFVTEFPVEVSPLSKRNPENPEFVDRFEMFIAGMEICNAFNELNDPFDQAERFQEQARARTGGDEEAHYYDAEFVTAIEYGLPPTVGAGIGIDRLVMLITGTTSIRDVILFPTMRKKED